MTLEERATKKGRPLAQLILGTTQVNPLEVLRTPIAKSANEAKDKRNPVKLKVNASPFTFVARLCFLRVTPSYVTKDNQDMATDAVLASWGGVSSGVSHDWKSDSSCLLTLRTNTDFDGLGHGLLHESDEYHVERYELPGP